MDDMQKPIHSDGLEEPYFGHEKCFPCPQVKKLEAERDKLRDVCECVMRSKELVLPGSGCLVKAEHAEEVRALSEMYSVVKQALENNHA